MSRLFVVIAALSSASALSLPAFAQLNEGPPMPSGMDLAKVPIGSWAEYAVVVGEMPSMKTRMALVGRSKGEATVEMVVEGGMMAAAGGKMIMQTVMLVEGGQGAGEVKKLVIQVGPNDPMEMPAALAQRKQFQKPDPKALIKEETVKVAAGTFKAKHYRDTTPKGDVLDYWLSDKVPPLGLVKVVGEQKGGVAGGQKGPVTFELSSFGKDAKTAVLKPVKPFDQQAFMGQLMGAAGAAAGAKGPAGAPPPAAPTK